MSDGPRERLGIAASPGIAIGPAFVLRRERLVIPEHQVEPSEIEGEVARLRAAVHATQERLRVIRAGMAEGGLVANLFDAQFLFLDDPALIGAAERSIRERRLNAEWALSVELSRLEALFESLPDPYLKSRADDVGVMVRRVLESLLGREPEGLANAPAGVIVVADDLSPADVAQVARGQIAAIVTEGGSRTSHVTIISRSLGIPAVVGTGSGLAREVPDGARVIVDGRAGRVIVEPGPGVVAEYGKRRADFLRLDRDALRYVDLPAETRDGAKVALLANVDLVEEIPDALRHGAEGIGLYRTEFLFLNRSDLPSEDEQVTAYRAILEAVAPRAAVIRTLDLGADKVPAGLGLHDEPNPALGMRGVRLGHARPEVFRAQLRALLRASPHGRLKILLPMVSSLDELRAARSELGRARHELAERGAVISARVPLGVMIETPAAAVIADLIAPEADFLSIGTNDLLQYTIAVDRTNEQVSYLYEPLHPANLRLIQRITHAARRSGIVAGMCGEMAGDPTYVWILLALGVGELSMTPFSIPLLKRILRDSTLAEARELLGAALRQSSAATIQSLVADAMRRRFPSEFEPFAGTG